MKLTRISFATLAASLLLPGLAAAHDYTYVDGGVLDRDGADDLGIRMAGSAGLTPPLAVFGELVDTGPFSQFSAGLMLHTSISPAVDFTAGGSMEAVDTGRRDDVGLGARFGMRWFVPETRGLELNPELRHVRVFDTSITSVRFNGLLPMTPNLHLQGALQAGDDDRIEFGMRYSFVPYGSRAQRSY